MELRHLRYFVAVAETENVSRAAVKLHVSQPALSRQIRDLEEELGFGLLERSAKSVRLTDAGRVFLAEARAVLTRADEAISTARKVADGTRSELHIGYAPTLAVRILPPTLRAFQSVAPRVRVKLHDLSPDEMWMGLREGKLSLAFTVKPSAGIRRDVRFEELLREPMCVAVAPTHPFARRRVVKISDVASEPLHVYSRKEYPDYHNLLHSLFKVTKPRIAEEHDGVLSLISAVEAGDGVAIVPRSMSCHAGARLKLLPLSPEPAPVIIGALHVETFNADASRFLECARDVARSLRTTN